jgi:hypothetical protein
MTDVDNASNHTTNSLRQAREAMQDITITIDNWRVIIRGLFGDSGTKEITGLKLYTSYLVYTQIVLGI